MTLLTTVPELVNAARAGEQTAWNALYRQYYPGLYAAALRICGDVPAARDAVQETFILAHLKLPQLREPATFGGWLKKILVHRCYRDLRSSRLNLSLDVLSPASDGWWADELDRKFDWLATQSRLYAALAQLPEVLRGALLLRYFSNFPSYEQMAAILGVPTGTVRSRLNQAKAKLTRQWQQLPDAGMVSVRESEAWNEFYQATYSGLHTDAACRNRLIHHLRKDILIIASGGTRITGNRFFEQKVAGDQQAGSWLKPDHVMSCGNISIVEVSHYNSSEHPDHCPARSVTVLYRKNGKADKMHLYTSPE